MPNSSQTQIRLVQPPATPSASDNSIAAEPVSVPQPQPVSGSVEFGPISTNTQEQVQPEKDLLTEISLSQPAEIEIPHELKNTVEKSPISQEPKIHPEVKKAGITASVNHLPVISTPWGNMKLPMTYIQAKQTVKDTKFDDSMHWLASVVMYEWCKFDPDVVKESKNK